jgi:hypothetical protein
MNQVENQSRFIQHVFHQMKPVRSRVHGFASSFTGFVALALDLGDDDDDDDDSRKYIKPARESMKTATSASLVLSQHSFNCNSPPG